MPRPAQGPDAFNRGDFERLLTSLQTLATQTAQLVAVNKAILELVASGRVTAGGGPGLGDLGDFLRGLFEPGGRR